MLPELDQLPPDHRSGFVAVIGRPNVGKSTLLNRILEQKIAIISPKPQTTRDQLMGIFTTEDVQIIFLDTPGLHKPRNRLGEYMMHVAEGTIRDADLLLWLVDANTPPTAGEQHIAALLRDLHQKQALGHLVIGLNKIDQLGADAAAEVLMQRADEYHALVDWFAPPDSSQPIEQPAPQVQLAADGAVDEEMDEEVDEMDNVELSDEVPPSSFAILPLSARNGEGVAQLLDHVHAQLPPGPRFYPADQITDLQIRFIVEELIREKALAVLEQEVPHSVAVAVDEFIERSADMTYISATIYVERDSQKKIVLGRGGSMIKQIGQTARPDIEDLVGTRVYLELWVKVWPKWRKRRDMLQRLGYAA